MAANPPAPARPRVTVCVDLADNAETIRAIHRRFTSAHGHLVLTVAPGSGAVEDLIRSTLMRLNVLWRLPTRLRPGRVVLAGEDRAIAEWEISWALTRAGITSLWCLDADNANPLAWHWLRDTAEREDLRLVLHTTTVPDTVTGAALTGCRVRTLSPQQLQGASRPSVPGWRRLPQRSGPIGGTDTPSRG